MRDLWMDSTFYQEKIDPKALAKVFEELPPPPCETFNCPNYEHCAETKSACEAFARYVARGNVPDTKIMRRYMEKPSQGIFNRLHPSEEE